MGLTAKKLRIKKGYQGMLLSKNVSEITTGIELKSFDQRSPDYSKIAIFPSH